ncbi:hypothetical protein C1Y63_08125 [Corynebacterium sp. 13CS0277]|uniref:YqgE/AlgH family protein n=1 Tax=Corynebacterium sp. 13CS0277 TaxID=2071994 RepID=UPI000D02B8BD|nr:YqgE/AlgH family protein [Corynebacterium sp. 13CS0277]PRQ11084.1 hypothetical protein C1Y63_08125 [Corynebacterium sp. 13CS0277]
MDDLFADRLYNAFERNDPEPGTLLLAAPDLEDDRFARSAILIVENNEHSTYGVDLTQFSDTAIASVFPELDPIAAPPKAVFLGGPVERGAAFAMGVVKTGVENPGDRPYFRHLGSRMVHVDLHVPVNEFKDELEGLRLFAGYAEWAPGQLNEEIERGDWFVTPALPSDILAGRNADVWGGALRRQRGIMSVFSTFPADLDMN